MVILAALQLDSNELDQPPGVTHDDSERLIGKQEVADLRRAKPQLLELLQALLTHDQLLDFEDRAEIMEFDGGLHCGLADTAARLRIGGAGPWL